MVVCAYAKVKLNPNATKPIIVKSAYFTIWKIRAYVIIFTKMVEL